MSALSTSPVPLPRGAWRVPPFVWHTIGLIIAVLVTWAVWRGYQNPDFVLDLAALRLC